MDLVVTGVVAGLLGTLAMDALNLLFARTGLLSRIDIATLGRMSAGWTHGRFCYRSPDEVEPVAGEIGYGYVAHYLIGVVLAVTYVVGWGLLIGGPVSPVWALAYGVVTTAASWFLVLPALGLGALGRQSPEGTRLALSSLANHLFYGMGMAVGIALA